MWLRVKVTAVFAACIAVPAALALGAAWIAGTETLREQSRLDLDTATQSLTAEIEARLAFNIAHLKTFAALPTMQNVLIADDGHEIARVLVELKEQYPEFTSLLATDARGNVVAATSEADRGRPAASDEGFREAASGSTYQSALAVRDAARGAAITFSVPVIASYDRQTVVGTLSGVVDVGALVKSAKATSVLASDRNVVLLSRRQDAKHAYATRSDTTLLDAVNALDGADSAGEIVWRDEPYALSSAASKGKGLVRDPGFVVRSVTPAGASLLGAIDQTIAIAAFVALLGAAAALFFAWRWATPLVRIGDAMERTARGETARAVDVRPADTFGPLARAFASLRQAKTMQTQSAARERTLLREKEDAEAALHAKSEHLASLARALKEQLATIVELSEAINSEALSAATGNTRASYAKDISRSGTQLLTVINDLFDLSEAEAGHAPLREAEIDLAQLVRESVAVMGDAADKAKLALGCTGTDAPMIVKADAQKLKQILFNLLSNAVKFTPEQGRVDVMLKTDTSGRPTVVIADTGIGMPPNLAPHAAAPFGTSGETTSHGRHGAGLGLPLARQLIELHDGALEIESEPHQGTTVTISLPASRLIASGAEAERLIA